MIKIVKGNLLNCKEDIIVHQVNCQGVFGGGLALQIANLSPEVERQYIAYCDVFGFDYEKLKGQVLIAKDGNLNVANIFSQRPDFTTDYKAMKECFTTLRDLVKTTGLTLAMPYKIGCGIANGDFDKVLDIILEVFSDIDVTLYKL